MNILLTGGAGYIGSHTAAVLASQDHNVVIFDNFCNSNESILNQIRQIAAQEIRCVKGDVQDSALLLQTLEEHDIDAVIHLAGLKAVGESTQKPLEYYDNNVVGTVSLLNAMKKIKVRKLVFSSSATVYGEPKYLPYDEKHPASPINTYGRTKLLVEHMLQDLAASDPTWHIAMLRYFNPVGAHESGLIGERVNGMPNNLMPSIMKVAERHLQHLNIFGDDYDTSDGTGERDYIHVMDLAEGHIAALNYLAKNAGCEIFNLGTGKPATVLELVKMYEKMSGQKIPIIIAPRRPGDLSSSYANSKKASDLMGWRATRNIEEMVASSLNWQKSKKEMD